MGCCSSSQTPPPSPAPVSPSFPVSSAMYKFLNRVGSGAYGNVYRASFETPEHKTIDVAVKVIDLEESKGNMEALAKEAQLLRMLKHDNIIGCYTAFIEQSSLFIVMPLFEGGSCLSLMKALCHGSGFTDECVLATILLEVLKGLQYMHANGNIHRDIKADNILVSLEGQVKVGDLGFATEWKLQNPTAHSQNRFSVVGTPCFMAPELAALKEQEEEMRRGDATDDSSSNQAVSLGEKEEMEMEDKVPLPSWDHPDPTSLLDLGPSSGPPRDSGCPSPNHLEICSRSLGSHIALNAPKAEDLSLKPSIPPSVSPSLPPLVSPSLPLSEQKGKGGGMEDNAETKKDDYPRYSESPSVYHKRNLRRLTPVLATRKMGSDSSSPVLHRRESGTSRSTSLPFTLNRHDSNESSGSLPSLFGKNDGSGNTKSSNSAILTTTVKNKTSSSSSSGSSNPLSVLSEDDLKNGSNSDSHEHSSSSNSDNKSDSKSDTKSDSKNGKESGVSIEHRNSERNSERNERNSERNERYLERNSERNSLELLNRKSSSAIVFSTTQPPSPLPLPPPPPLSLRHLVVPLTSPIVSDIETYVSPTDTNSSIPPTPFTALSRFQESSIYAEGEGARLLDSSQLTSSSSSLLTPSLPVISSSPKSPANTKSHKSPKVFYFGDFQQNLAKSSSFGSALPSAVALASPTISPPRAAPALVSPHSPPTITKAHEGNVARTTTARSQVKHWVRHPSDEDDEVKSPSQGSHLDRPSEVSISAKQQREASANSLRKLNEAATRTVTSTSEGELRIWAEMFRRRPWKSGTGGSPEESVVVSSLLVGKKPKRPGAVGYSVAVDVWSFGILCLELAYGKPPDHDLHPSAVVHNRATSCLSYFHRFPKSERPMPSRSFQDLVNRCLQQDPAKRPTVAQLLKHKFFKKARGPDYLKETLLKQLPPGYLGQGLTTGCDLSVLPHHLSNELPSLPARGPQLALLPRSKSESGSAERKSMSSSQHDFPREEKARVEDRLMPLQEGGLPRLGRLRSTTQSWTAAPRASSPRSLSPCSLST